MISMKNISIAALLAACTVGAGAQDHSIDLEDVVVLSDKIQIPFKKQNRNIQVLTAEQIAQIPARSVNELLSYVAGVDVRQRGPNGTQADIGIDGGTFDQTLVLINGFKMSDAQTGHNMMNIPVPIEAIERIEVLKGAAARIYGVNALMGVINIVTKKAADNNFTARVYSGSNFQADDSTGKTYFNYGAQVVGQIATDKWQHLVAGSLDEGNGYRYNTAYSNKRAIYSAKGQLNAKAHIELMGGIANSDFGANAFYAAPRDIESTEEVNTVNLAFRLPVQVSKNWLLRPSANYRNGYDHYVFVRQNPAIFQNKHRTHTVDASLDNIITTKYGDIALGLNVRNERIISTNLGHHSRINYGAFAEYQFQYSDRLDVNAGIYFNQNSVFGSNAYPGIDVGYKINNAMRVYANAGMGQRLPTFTDLYYVGPGNMGNEDLRPEFMTSYEAGLKYIKNKLQVNAAVFYKDGRDFIDWVRPDTSTAWMVNNFTNINTRGLHIDAGYKVDLADNAIILSTGYTYLDPRIGKTSDEDKQHWQSQYAVNALQHQWIARAGWSWKDQWQVSLTNRSIYRLNTGTPVAGYAKRTYQLTDLRLDYKFRNVSLDLVVNNLFNVRYIESGVVPLPGRWMTLGLTYNLK